MSTGTSKPLHNVLNAKLRNNNNNYEGVAIQPVMDEVAKTAEKNVEQHKLNEIYIAYRLAGCTVFNVNETRVGIRFDTSYRGRYYESYYVFLDTDPETGEVCVYRHSLPYFIDMDDLGNTLSRDVREFLTMVEDLLGALVSRRQQVMELEREFEGRVHDIACSHAFDFVQGLIVSDDVGPDGEKVLLEFQLHFGALLATKPKKILIKTVGDGKVRLDLQRRFMAKDDALLCGRFKVIST